jgi:plastocyanin domain-containing protein
MTSDQIIVTLVGMAGIALVYWFFLMKKTREIAVADSVDITVDGGYSPEVIAIPKGKTTKLNFLRKDPSNCLEEVVLGDFKIRKHLPLNQKVTVELTPQQAGEFSYACGMNMYHGKIIVKEAA